VLFLFILARVLARVLLALSVWWGGGGSPFSSQGDLLELGESHVLFALVILRPVHWDMKHNSTETQQESKQEKQSHPATSCRTAHASKAVCTLCTCVAERTC
jgi:hypothetical protein